MINENNIIVLSYYNFILKFNFGKVNLYIQKNIKLIDDGLSKQETNLFIQTFPLLLDLHPYLRNHHHAINFAKSLFESNQRT